MAKSKKKAKLSAFSRFSKQQMIIAAVFILGFGGIGIWKLAFSSAATSRKTNSKYYNTLITNNGPGMVTVCKTSTTVEMKIISVTGTGYSWWFDSQNASSGKIKAGATAYKSVPINGSNFMAYVWSPGAGGYGPAQIPVATLNNCATAPTTGYLETAWQLTYANGSYQAGGNPGYGVVKPSSTSPSALARMTNYTALKDVMTVNGGKFAQVCIKYRVPSGSTWITLYNIDPYGTQPLTQQYVNASDTFSTLCTAKAIIPTPYSGLSYPDVRSGNADLYIKDMSVVVTN